MSTTTTTAAAIDAAALRACLLAAENDIARHSGFGRLEDAQVLRLPEHHGRSMGDRFWFEISSGGPSYHQLGEQPQATWTKAKLIADVLALRAQDPGAAHDRDLGRAAWLVADRLAGFERAWARLIEQGPTRRWDHAEGEPVYGIANDSYSPMCPLHDRDLYARLLAYALAAQARLIAAGPHQPDQGRLF
jgi:hypothetical protein